MSSESSSPVRKWKEPTPEQRVSHRAILRFRELADEFARDLNEILRATRSDNSLEERPPNIGVYFISSDRNPDLLPDSYPDQDCCRYYNLRLLETYRLTGPDNEEIPIKPALDWIKVHFTDFEPLFRCSDHLENHQHDHYAQFERLVEALKAERKSEKIFQLAEQVHDLIVEAISAMPYTGLLPSALDEGFRKENYLDLTVPVQFDLKFGDKENDGKVCFPCFKKIKKVDLKKNPDSLISRKAFKDNGEKQAKDLGRLYIGQFINWFTLGFDPVADSSKMDSPYQFKGHSGDLEGLALPVFHFHDHAGEPVGGCEGWAVIHFSTDPLSAKLAKTGFSMVRSKLIQAKAAFHLACRSFSRRVREERMRELIEKEWSGRVSDPRGFTLAHFNEFDGWIADSSLTLEFTNLEPHWIFCFLRQKNNTVQIYDEKQSGEDSNQHANVSKFYEPSLITHVAVVPPLRGKLPDWTKPLIFCKRRDTLLPPLHDDVVKYGFHITQSVHQIYEMASLKQARQKQDLQSGFLASAHDYSKDLNVLDGLVGTILEEFCDLEQKVTGMLPDSESKKEVAEGFRRLDRLKGALNLRNRFVMSHDRTESQSRFYAQPEWCVRLVESGCMKDLDELIDLLVWQPLGWIRYHDLAGAHRRNRLPRNEVADWYRLFAYDDRGMNPAIDELLGAYLHKLFVPPLEAERPGDLPALGISREEFGRLHPPPVLNEHQGYEPHPDNQILWSPLSLEDRGKRWLPAAELLPLLVFSLRAAFQHAWLRTFLDAEKGNPEVTQHIHLEAKDERHTTGDYSIYSLHLDFPAPESQKSDSAVGISDKTTLPWGDWDRQMNHYNGKVRPWRRWETTLVAPIIAKENLESPPSGIHLDPWHYQISIYSGI